MKKDYTAQENSVMAKQCKDFMNITYGKSVSKEVEESHRFITQKQFKETVDSSTLIDYEI